MDNKFHRVDTDFQSSERSWKQSRGEKGMELVYTCFDILKSINENFELKYHPRYIGLSDGEKEIDYINLFPVKANLHVALNINNREKRMSDIVVPKPEDSFVNFKLSEENIEMNRSFLKELFSISYQKYVGTNIQAS
jgi:hypothetical protein